MYDYESHTKEELSFKKDDLFFVINTDGDWWLAYSQDTNKKGYIPSNYMAELTYPIHAAVYDYESRTDEDLSFKKGDLLCIINTDDTNWWFARSKNSGKEGYVPSNYLTSSVVDGNSLYVYK